MKKVGSFLSGSLLRWITLKSNFTLWSAVNKDTKPTKCYSLVGCEVEWGKLATKEYAIRITCRKKKKKTGSVSRKKKLLTLIVEDVGSMNMWVGGLRCLFAGTDRILCTENEVGGSTCSICLGDFEEDEELMILPCNHRFCATGCLARWVSISPKCPMCKRSCLVHGELMIRRGTWKVVGGGESGVPMMFFEIHAPRKIGEVSNPSVVTLSTLAMVSSPPRGTSAGNVTLRRCCPVMPSIP